MLEIQKQQMQYNFSARYSGIEYIVVHDTGNYSNGANAEMHFRYFNGGNRNASADFFVDDSNIIQFNDYNKYYSWHCGDGGGKYSITNGNSIGIEMCINNDGNYEQTVLNTIDLVKYLMKTLNINIDHVVRHYDASRKNCPQTMNNNGDWSKWWNFKEKLTQNNLVITDKLGVATILTDNLNLRNNPDGTVITQLRKDAKFKVTGITNNGWYRIAYNGDAAYISANPQFVQYSDGIGGYITMEDLNELKKALKIPNSSWAGPEIQKEKANGIIVSDHDPNEICTFGVMITVMNNIYEQLRRKGSI